MKYQAAFERLGYKLISVRQDWSAASENGVCISLWQSEIAWRQRRPLFDTRLHADEPNTWVTKAGATRRTQHLALARDQFDGWVDVVLRHGSPRDTNSVASSPWIVGDRENMKWRLTFFDEITRQFAVEAKVAP